jgi:hypothetical protein
MLDELKRAMKRERFRYGKKLIPGSHYTYFNANVRYLARRYARFISGSECTHCWTRPCYCGMNVPYTPAEKIAYEYQKETQNK